MRTQQPKQILIAPLDWGLGHTTRCIPIIRYIRSLGHNPIFAGNSSQRSFIEETFGAIDIIHLEGCNIIYSKWNKLAQMGLLSQVPRIHRAINNEHDWLLKLSKQRQLDGIISDNRYGLFHPSIPSVILTHQLAPQTGMGSIANHVIQKLHYKYLNHYNATWVVDVPGDPNLSGKLSHTAPLPLHVKYIGLLSRFADMESEGGNPKDAPLLILLSGPEPQRSTLSGILWRQVQKYAGNVIFIEGSDTAVPPRIIPDHIIYYKRLADDQLAPILQKAGMVICRSGYSTLIDLAALRKKAILIPTPGQTEQEYLGRSLHDSGIFYCAKQRGFDLATSLRTAAGFAYNDTLLKNEFSVYKKVLEEWLGSL